MLQKHSVLDLPFGVVEPNGYLVATTRHVEDAAAIVRLYGAGTTICDLRDGCRLLWKEGAPPNGDGFARESYDNVAAVALERIEPLSWADFLLRRIERPNAPLTD